MAAVLASAVTVVDSWTEASVNGKLLKGYRLTIVLSSQGGATNNIPANIIGSLTYIYQSTSAVYSDNSAIVPTSPSADGTLLLIGGGGANAPQDITATINVVVKGY